jgi:hypothetical protein
VEVCGPVATLEIITHASRRQIPPETHVCQARFDPKQISVVFLGKYERRALEHWYCRHNVPPFVGNSIPDEYSGRLVWCPGYLGGDVVQKEFEEGLLEAFRSETANGELGKWRVFAGVGEDDDTIDYRILEKEASRERKRTNESGILHFETEKMAAALKEGVRRRRERKNQHPL